MDWGLTPDPPQVHEKIQWNNSSPQLDRDGQEWEGLERDVQGWTGMEKSGKGWIGLDRDG